MKILIHFQTSMVQPGMDMLFLPTLDWTCDELPTQQGLNLIHVIKKSRAE